jgi:hypothetical protein
MSFKMSFRKVLGNTREGICPRNGLLGKCIETGIETGIGKGSGRVYGDHVSILLLWD